MPLKSRAGKRGFHAHLHRLARHRDQHLLAGPDRACELQEIAFYPPGKHPATPTLCTAPLWVGRRRAKEEGWTLIEGTATLGGAGGHRTARAAYEELRDEILGQLKAALPVDGVMLGLHGAMVAHGYDDCEGDLLERVRAIVGPKVRDRRRARPAQPPDAEARRALPTSSSASRNSRTPTSSTAPSMSSTSRSAPLRGEVKPVMSVFDCRMIDMLSDQPPADARLRRPHQGAGRQGRRPVDLRRATASPMPTCRRWARKILVVTDDDKAKGDALATELGARVLRACAARPCRTYSTRIDGAIDQALGGRPAAPVVIADPSDNPGGGAPADATPILRRLLDARRRRRRDRPDLGPDRGALLHRRGRRRQVPAALRRQDRAARPASRSMPRSRCSSVVRDGWQTFGTARVPLGDCAAIRVGGIDVVLISNRTQALRARPLHQSRHRPRWQETILVVKSTNHFHGCVLEVAVDSDLYCDSDGPIPRDHRKVPYTSIQRPIWPLDELAEPALVV